MISSTRRGFLIAAGATAIAGCTGGSSNDGSADGGADGSAGNTETTDTATASETDSPTKSPGGTNGSDGKPPTADRVLPLPMKPKALQEEAVSGGPPKDGIPSIDQPAFEAADEVGKRLGDGDIVFGVVRNGEAKAYPQNILVWHEICNDKVGGEPVSVTYCPLTGTAMGFERGDTTFGVSGRLINNNLIMYDRGTETWWPQVLATSIPGPWNAEYKRRSLDGFRVVWTTWENWRSQYPDTTVLTEDTGFARNYDRDPYGQYNPTQGYYSDANTIFPKLNPDDRHHPKDVVIGARTADGATAFLKESLLDKGVLEGDLAGTPVVAVSDPSLDTGYIYTNPDEETVSVGDDGVTVNGSTHAPADLPLDHVLAFDAMWFAWAGFYPETSVHE